MNSTNIRQDRKPNFFTKMAWLKGVRQLFPTFEPRPNLGRWLFYYSPDSTTFDANRRHAAESPDSPERTACGLLLYSSCRFHQ
jgi:hypothetical protein